MKTPTKRHIYQSVAVSLGMSLAALSQTAIPIDNPGFESPVLPLGSFDNVNGWTVVGSPVVSGAVHPTTSEYPGGAPEGNNVAFIAANADGDGLAQILTDPQAALKSGAAYTLTVQVGNPDGAGFDFEGYRVQLLAAGQILAEDDNALSPAAGAFATSTVNYTYDAGPHEALLGQPLEIRLLSKAIVAGETNFDDVNLTVTQVEPVADAGGPYTVFTDGFLALDGSGSVPPDGGVTIDAYEWDLNNDGNFTDATGATPAAISFSELTADFGMALGPNTIQLRITDSESNTSITSTTVNIEIEPDLVVLISDNQGSGNPIELFFTENFSNVAEIRHANYADFSAQATQDALYGTGVHEGNGPADLVVIGRTLSSVNYQNGVSDGYNTLEIPVINFTSYTARQDNNRLGWHASAVSTTKSIAADETTVTSAGATILGLVAGTHDFFSESNNFNGLASGTTTFGGGEILAMIGGDTLAAYWAPGTAPGNVTNAGVATFPGPRLLFNLDRDGADNFINLTPIGLNALISSIDFATPLTSVPIAPEIASLNPANNAAGVYPGIGQLVVTFTKPIILTGQGSVTIQNLGDLSGGSDIVINLPDASSVNADGLNLVIEPASNLAFDTSFAIQISGDAVTDLDGNPFAGINDSITWTFTTVVENPAQPAITLKSPEHEASGVGVGSSITVTFDQNLILGTGNIVIKDLVDDSSTQTIPVTDESQVSLVDNVLSINPATVLESARPYAVLIPATAARNFSDVNIAGISSDAEWNFTTSSLVSQLGILDLAANGGINPATGLAWTAGDTYHLLYVTTATTTATSTNIADYNAFVQTDADSEGMGAASWFALGSTTSTNAIDNVIITGSVFNVFNNRTVATGAADLWDFQYNPNHMSNLVGEDRNVWTGSSPGGVANGANELGATNGTTRRHWTGWTDWGPAFATQNNVDLREMVAISGRLFVIDLQDGTDPALISIDDNVVGGSVSLNDDPLITYTVTFNEAMLPSTVDASDFGNAGSAGFSVNSIVQQEDAAVFLVTVTPLSAGTLQLQINASAPLTDLNGNPLDTSVALLDDAIINVEASAASPFDDWASGFAGLTDTGPALDFDGGGLATALEWVLGGDPTNPGDDASIAPAIDATSDPDGKLLFVFRRNIDAGTDPDTTIVVEYGSNLAGWTAATHQGTAPADITISVVPDGFAAGIDEVTVALPPSLANGGKLFVRLNVGVATEPPPVE